MHSFLRKAIGAMVIVILLASVLMTPATSRAGNTSDIASQNTQANDGLVRVYNSQTGALNFIRIPLEKFGTYEAKNSTEALTNFTGFANEFGVSNVSEQLSLVNTQKTTGLVSYRYQQVYKDVPVFGGELRMIYNANGQLTAISGEISDDLTLSVVPNYEATSAAQQALSYISRKTGVAMAFLTVSAPELMIYDASLISPHVQPKELVWKFEVTSLDGSPINYLVLVNAHLHGISLAFNQIDTFWSNDNPRAHTVSSIAEPTDPMQVDSLPPMPTNNPMWSPHYNGTSKTYNSNNTSALPGTLICTDIQPTTVTLVGANSCNGSSATPAGDANAAQYFAIKTFDYFDFYHDRNSINDNGMVIISSVKFTYGGSYANAFWNGNQMVYGNAGFFAADDVVSHELAHGVTQHTSNLFYYYESGAINEAISDVFGEYNDLLNGTNSRGTGSDGIANAGDPYKWLVGEDLDVGAIRNMANPPAFGDPDRTRSGNYKSTGLDENDPSFDNGGVHSNSGVANKAAYLMANGGSFNGYTVTRLGTTLESSIELAGQIWYAVEYLLTSGSDYQVLDQALQAACEGLINVTVPGTTEKLTASDCVEVDEATLATQMHLEPAYAGFSPEANLTCNNPAHTIQNLYYQDFETGTSGFTFVYVQGASLNWQRIDNYAYAGEYALWGEDVFTSSGNSDNYARLNGVSLSGSTEYYLYFKHSYGFEDILWDGGVLEYSINGGSTWTDASGRYKDGRGYGGVFSAGSRNGFVNDSHGFGSSRYDLSPFAGQTIMFRWRIITDDIVQDLGWILDDVRIYRCVAGGSVPVPPSLMGPTHRTHTTDRTPTFLWNAVPNARSYRIFIYNETRSFESKTRVFDNYYTPTTNLPIQKYLWRVRTQDNTSGLWSGWTTRWTLFIDP